MDKEYNRLIDEVLWDYYFYMKNKSIDQDPTAEEEVLFDLKEIYPTILARYGDNNMDKEYNELLRAKVRFMDSYKSSQSLFYLRNIYIFLIINSLFLIIILVSLFI